VTVFIADEQSEPLEPGTFVALSELVLREEGMPAEAELAIVFVDLAQITEYNVRFMGRQGPTDVLAFPLEELRPGVPPVGRPGGPPPSLGDVFICPEVVRANADSAGVPFEDEMALIVVHGILHLLGYDHGNDAEAAVMEEREQRLLTLAGRELP
jgi:probable rRNA maturation factor